jgi:uncharacterized protein
MKGDIKSNLIKVAQECQVKDDPSHDFQHILRVLNLAEKIGKSVKADLDIVIPAALFHDLIVYRKNTPQSKNESDESADIAGEILSNISEYPQDKIKSVQTCIRQCSFSKGITPKLLESKVLQDADRLEATGVISIMRTFASSGQMGRQFYDPTDPFCDKGTVKFRSAIDLFYSRLLVVEKTMYTKMAKRMAKKRTAFLKKFLAQFKNELVE